ncbi:predicted protein [Lichtheimia corymbifera JMRC:FSU:9682]|uniref:Uncharacterized protein n=1 Tax=Lichtheimia corymbifera JMRC:FSU:9682 TaxID=1263082 RepID=A0A068SC64_9FUNG|nr:predicted protein [Lichtheimia corymbifera JMRC:FSU:9682]
MDTACIINTPVFTFTIRCAEGSNNAAYTRINNENVIASADQQMRAPLALHPRPQQLLPAPSIIIAPPSMWHDTANKSTLAPKPITTTTSPQVLHHNILRNNLPNIQP